MGVGKKGKGVNVDNRLKALRVGQRISTSIGIAQVDKITPDGRVFVVTEGVQNTSKGPTNYYELREVTEFRLVPQ